jgi:nitrate reductase beta subunit
MGVLLYDAELLPGAMSVPEQDLVESQRSALLNPFDPEVIAAAERNGISPEFIEAAQNSPVWRYVMEWKIALPLHPEFRTFPMLFYVPPLLPVSGRSGDGIYEHEADEFFASTEKARVPVKFLASLFSAGNVEIVEGVLKKLMAVRYHMRSKSVDETSPARVKEILRKAGITEKEAEDIYRLTALCGPEDRYVMPPIQREEAMAGMGDSGRPESCKGSCGLGATQTPVRGA